MAHAFDAKQLRTDIELIDGVYDDFDKEEYLKAKISPVFFGSAVNNFGIKELLDAFIQFASWNINDEPLYFAACIPIEEEILTTPLSDITGHYQEEYSALKITLKGSYSHRKEVWTKALAFIEQNEEYIFASNDKQVKLLLKVLAQILISGNIAPIKEYFSAKEFEQIRAKLKPKNIFSQNRYCIARQF